MLKKEGLIQKDGGGEVLQVVLPETGQMADLGEGFAWVIRGRGNYTD